MAQQRMIHILDNNKSRAEQLSTICSFIGETSKLCHYSDWVIEDSSHSIVILGARESSTKTIEELTLLKEKCPQMPVILVDGSLSSEECSPFPIAANLKHPFNYTQLLEALHKCQLLQEQLKLNTQKQDKSPLFQSLVGESEAIYRVRKLITQVADTEASVLVLGESGTGKEVVARSIHALSSRASKPFVPINCGAIPAELLESELFGHEKGAFTGAFTSRQGRFELANGGTLFLDEIGDMPLPMQVKLLRVLQERTFERVGSNKTIDVNVRIIAATHRNLDQAINDGKFREDLYYRLNVFPIEMPPLRERRQDVSLLFNELISRIESSGRPIVRLLPDALDTLKDYQWPGNVRELANLVERLTILYPGAIIDHADLPRRFRGDTARFIEEDVQPASDREALMQLISQDIESNNDGIDLKEHLVKTELSLINQALEETDWVVAHAASYLNMRRTTLVEKMRKYGLSRPEKEESEA